MIDIFATAHSFVTALGLLTIVPTGHGAVCLKLNEKIVYVDPYSEACDYTDYPKADLILFTHDHYDHYDVNAYSKITKEGTQFAGARCCADKVEMAKIFEYGTEYEWNGIKIKAVPAYNINNKNEDGNPFHPKGYGIGFMFYFGNFTLYLSGDTEFIPEMESYPAMGLNGKIDVAMLAKNLPYTMSDDEFIKAVKALKVNKVYPIHYFELDKAKLEKALPGVELLYK